MTLTAITAVDTVQTDSSMTSDKNILKNPVIDDRVFTAILRF